MRAQAWRETERTEARKKQPIRKERAERTEENREQERKSDGEAENRDFTDLVNVARENSRGFNVIRHLSCGATNGNKDEFHRNRKKSTTSQDQDKQRRFQ
jgi:hypothetical protein